MQNLLWRFHEDFGETWLFHLWGSSGQFLLTKTECTKTGFVQNPERPQTAKCLKSKHFSFKTSSDFRHLLYWSNYLTAVKRSTCFKLFPSQIVYKFSDYPCKKCNRLISELVWNLNFVWSVFRYTWCLKSELFGNQTVIECLKHITVNIWNPN